MKSIILTAALLALSGCGTMSPRQEVIVTTFVAASIAVALSTHHSDSPAAPDSRVPGKPNCAANPRLCR